MPVVIRELIIRASVNDASPGTGNATASASPQASLIDREALIQECVEQVLEILEKKKER